jgi:hypothetical protein
MTLNTIVADYLVVLQAFHGLQASPDFMRRGPHFAISYQLWAQGAVPNYRQQSARRSGVNAGPVINSADPEQGYHLDPLPIYASPICSSPASSSPVPACYDGFFDTPDTGIITPPTSVFDGNWHRQSFASFMPETSKSFLWRHDSGNEGEGIDNVPSLLFSSRSSSTHIDHDADFCPLPLPPLTILMAWHAHMMQPDKYACALERDYRALRDVPFPLKEAVSPTM